MAKTYPLIAETIESYDYSELNKLPQITIFFWIMKICATTLGETAGDLLSMTLDVGYAVSSLILISAFLATFAAQMLSKRHNPLLYWTVILSTSTAGTTMSDFMDRTAGLGYMKGAAILFGLLIAILVFWRLRLGSLSVNDIRSRKVEFVYWITILFSNTLGTALGDFLSDSSGLGFTGGALLIAGLLALVVAAFYFTEISRVALFWIAFVLTRPFGAQMGDILTKPHVKGGLELGTIGSSLVLAAILIFFIAFTYFKERQVKDLTTV